MNPDSVRRAFARADHSDNGRAAAVDNAAFPDELIELDQWVAWRYETLDNGKRTKVLLQPSALSQRASSTDRRTWGSYKLTAAKLALGGTHPLVKVDGLGWVVTEDDPYVVLDLDDCVTDGVIHPAAQAIIDALNSWWEFSPSGTGIHIIVRGTKPEGLGCKGMGEWDGKIECYDRARFLTMTGNGTGEIRECSEVIAVIAERYLPTATPAGEVDWDRAPTESVDDDALLTRAREDDPRLAELYETIPSDADDWSSLDFALCCKLAEHTDDPRQIERLMTASALGQRDKWTNRKEYRRGTIEKAIAQTAEVEIVDGVVTQGGTLEASARQPAQEAAKPREVTSREEKRLRQEVDDHRRRRQAKRTVDYEEAEESMKLPPARDYSLAAYRAEEKPPKPIRIEKLQLKGHRVVLIGQFKTGKTTAQANLVASLVDGMPFLGQFKTVSPEGNVGVWNAEMDGDDYEEYLNAAGVVNERRVQIWNLRGYRVPLFSDAGHERAAQWLRENEVKYWIIDPWSRICSWAGVSESKNEEVTPLLQRVDEIADEAGVEEILISHHAGWVPGRARGATALVDWPDGIWTYESDENGRRFFRAQGRRVGLDEGAVTMDDGKLTFHEGGRKATRLEENVDKVEMVVLEHPEGIPVTEVKYLLDIANTDKSKVIRQAIQSGRVRQEGSESDKRVKVLFPPAEDISPEPLI